MKQKSKLALVVAVVVVAAVGLGLGFSGSLVGHRTASTTTVPDWCQTPQGGYLIVASIKGWNDSISHGAPSTPWPVVSVHVGDNVTIVVCNVDTQPHGFQMSHYYDSNIVTVAPGQMIRVSFQAKEAGTFTMYCSILCSIHIFMQNARFVVAS